MFTEIIDFNILAGRELAFVKIKLANV